MIQESVVVKVGIADMNIVKSPNTIRTSGLGSCVGVILYHPLKKMAGLAHIMLPDSSLARSETVHKAKYADTAIESLIQMLSIAGADKNRLKAKIAGGAEMFKFTTKSEVMRIGPRNVEAVKNELKRFSIPLIAEDVGGSSGRTIEFIPETGKLMIRTVNQSVKEI